VLKTGKPEALRINVGNVVAAPVGPAATTVSNVSLLSADLLKAPTVPVTAAPAPPPPARAPAARPRGQARAAAPAATEPSPPAATPVTTNSQ